MMNDMTGSGMMWGMGLAGILGLLAIALLSRRSLNTSSSDEICRRSAFASCKRNAAGRRSGLFGWFTIGGFS